MTIEVVRYDAGQREAWDEVLANSKNGLFLFDRDYMEYHADRFVDFSVIAYVDGKPAVLFPASFEKGDALAVSHRGLTFGGFVIARDLRTDVGLVAIDQILADLRGQGAARIEVRPVPLYLCKAPSEEVGFALWRHGLALVHRNISSLLSLDGLSQMNSNKLRNVAKARKLGMEVAEVGVAEFYPLVEEVLRERYGKQAVHTLEELTLLQARFPEQIVIRCARLDGALLAGTVIYRYGHVSHTQYLAAPEQGRKTNALDLVIADCIELERSRGATAFSFGTSMEGNSINEGLLRQKESFGARSVVHEAMQGELRA